MKAPKSSSVRNLAVIFGDQLNADSSVFENFDPQRDRVWMAESAAESKHVWASKQRIAVFLSAMRHFCDLLRAQGIQVAYRELGATRPAQTLWEMLSHDLGRLKPTRVVATHPGEWRILDGLRRVCRSRAVELEVREDRHFYCSLDDFREHAEGRKSLRLEFFYREMRRLHKVLMDGDSPVGDRWNFDAENRASFGTAGPKTNPPGPACRPDGVTHEVLALVDSEFADHPGSLADFGWPVTRKAALDALDDFVATRLPDFGRYQDALWSGHAWLYHSWLSSALNLKLLNPREVVGAAELALQQRLAPLASVEGLIRQILGWREFVRGVYWFHMPGYLDRNALGAEAPLPEFYWTGRTDLACLADTIGQTLRYGYAHHIQRLMVTGLYALLLGVNPKRVHEWYLAVYVDAVEWVELPNTLGMSQFADGGLLASKPYVATGKYIDRMSNYCSSCPKNPARRAGADACPFTVLYWDFLLRHEDLLRKNQRMSLQVRNLDRITPRERSAIRKTARAIRANPALARR